MKTRYALISALVLLLALSAFATRLPTDFSSLGSPGEEKVELKLSVDLGLKEDTLDIGKEEEVKLELTIVVETEAKVWEGECPSSLIYDFSLTCAECDKEVWRWSRDKMFAMVITPVIIEGSAKYTEVANLSPKLFEKEGKYLLTATFVASGQSITQSFEVKFVK